VSQLVGQNLGPYSLLEVIGGGGMATVYKAYQPSADRFVAVKVIRADLSREPELRQRFEREARTIAQLEHPAILPIYDVGEHNGVPFLVMRYVEGGSLSDRISAGRLPLGQAVEYIAQLGEALAYAHQQGIIHRDIKPANVLITPRGHVLLSDFGIAKILADENGLTGTGMPIGTPFYMAPEQIQGKPVDARTDIYSLGIVLYECLIGQRPFVAETPWAVMDMQLRDAPPPPRALRPEIPESLERVILKATAKQPEHRFESMEALVQALREVDLEADAPAQEPATGPTLRGAPATVVLGDEQARGRPSAWLWGGAAALVLAAVAAILWLATFARGDRAAPAAAAPTAVLVASTMALATAAAPQTPVLAPNLRFSFDDGRADRWDGSPEQWRVVRDETNRLVYEGQAPDTALAATSPQETATALLQLKNYAVELRARIVTPGLKNDDFADFWLSLRAHADLTASKGCESYSFYFDSTAGSEQIVRNGGEQCGGLAILTSASMPLQPNRWYTIRTEAAGHHLRLLIDGAVIAEADDDRLEGGFFYMTLGQGARVQFDDIQIIPLPSAP
jgi:tRNA A-37 threonylcarbamoyl transferase component Bud32